MAENLLIHVLLGEIQLERLLEWLKRKHFETDGEISKFRCSQTDFLSYFLNYVHSEAPCSNATVDNAQKVFAPKPVKKQDLEERTAKSRPSLVNANALDSKPINSDSVGFSTPKSTRTHPDCVPNELNSSYMSPVSPLYSNANFNTPRNKRPPSSAQKSSERSLCLGDFIIHKTNSGKKKVQKNLCELAENESKSKKSRRINPTKLNQRKQEGNFQELGNSFNFQNEFVELRADDMNEQRSLLAEERVKITGEIKSEDVTKLVSHYNLHKANKTEVKADRKLVTHRKELDVLAEIYGCVLVNNLVLNLTSELYFLILLLITKRYVGESEAEDDCAAFINTQALSSDEVNFLVTNVLFLKTLLKTVHNSVYFAVRTLGLLGKVLHFLDRSTVKLLKENVLIKEYSDGTNLLQNLLVIHEHKADQFGGEPVENVRVNNVCFVLDTDNRGNFPSDASFHAFRKQRDLFYDVLRIWEQNHCVSGWSFAIALGGKIKGLLNLYGDPVNYSHFARLFRAQLLTTCRSCGGEEGMTETEMSFLSAIPNVDADKLCRLKSRLVTKQVTEGINSAPQFPGHQEFYKEFIVSSSVHAFHVHLRDALISEILQLNDTKFCDSELNDAEINVDVTTRSSYLACVKSLRILAKFLGFLESLPYKIDRKVPSEKVLASEIKTRLRTQPAFDLKHTVIDAIENKTLTLTVPWLTKYLSMLDYVTLRLPYYESTFQLLFHVHLNCTASSNDLLLRLCLGWLFELPHFPSELYFRWYMRETTTGGDLLTSRERGARDSLDDLDVVDSYVLYTCCPYLDEIKKLLVFNGCNNGGTVIKHITPLSAVNSAADVSEKKLRAQLEEAFFNGQPVSVRKTVEFVSERVASACVKFMCGNTVPHCKKSFAAQVQNETPPRETEIGESHMILKAQDCLKKLQLRCWEESERMAGERVPVSINMLLSPDELVQVKETCSVIARRMCLSRVQQWMSSHVNLGIFNWDVQKISTEKAKDKPAFLLPPSGREIPHNPGAQSAVKLVENIRQLSIDVLQKNAEITVVDVHAILDCVRTSVQERCDVNDSILSVVGKMLLDLYLLLLAHRCDISEDGQLVTKLVDHWRAFGRLNEDLFKTIFCPRNVVLLAQSGDVQKTWGTFTQFVIILLRSGLLTSDVLESQCVTIYQNEWDKATLKHFSCCFRAIVDDFAPAEGKQNITRLISGSCSDMDIL